MMKTFSTTILMIILLGNLVNAQPIPADSLYLGQVPPGNTPQIFRVAVSPGTFAGERIAISADNKEIYYTGIQGYYPTHGDTMKYYRYSGNRWTGPFNLFPDYPAPAFSVTGDTLFMQHNGTVAQSFYAVRNGNEWSGPHRIMSNLNSAHYLQQTNSGRFYLSCIPASGAGSADWCRVDIHAPDTTAVSIGPPVSSSANNLDFFVARDESYMILAKSGLKVSYHKNDGGWTNPKDLGPQINFGLGMWGPCVSADNKYLFYTTGTIPDYSDTHIYWVRVDHLLDSLKHTNYIPYVKNTIPPQSAAIGRMFQYSVPDTTFIDDDGNNTLKYTARLTTGKPLPGWLAFDSVAVRFSGIPDTILTLNIRITATDPQGVSVYTTLRINIGDTTSINSLKNHGLRIFPNPTKDLLHISVEDHLNEPLLTEICNLEGRVLLKKGFLKEGTFDLSAVPKGIYILKALVEDEAVVRRICVY